MKGQKHKIRKNRFQQNVDHYRNSESDFDNDYDFELDEYFDRDYSNDWDYDPYQEESRILDKHRPNDLKDELYTTKRSKRKRKNKHSELDFN